MSHRVTNSLPPPNINAVKSPVGLPTNRIKIIVVSPATMIGIALIQGAPLNVIKMNLKTQPESHDLSFNVPKTGRF